jgi:acyl-CoA synthetase (AMP-forming)/AMP-acid ligase II
MFEMLVHMRAMTRRFRLTRASNEPIELEAQINLRPRSNLMMTVEMNDDSHHPDRVLERNNRNVDRAVTYVDGENSERRVSYGDMHTAPRDPVPPASLGAQRGDKMIIFLNNNEQFLDGFWAALCGGIVPVPLAVGISDEHRHKLLRVARKVGKPYLYTDAKNLERLGALAAEVGETALFEDSSRAASWSNPSPTFRGRASWSPDPRRSGLHSILLRLHQRAQGRDAHPRQSHRQYRRRTAVDKYNDQDVSLSWMPLTHDMGLIGFYPHAVREPRAHQSDAHGLVRAPAAALAANGRQKASPSPARRTSATGIS